MTVDRPSNGSSSKVSAATSAPKWSVSTGRSPQISSNTRSPGPITPSILRKVGHGDGPRTPAADVKEDAATPVKSTLSANITPRSGLRRARVENASPTPRRTPEGSSPSMRPVSMIEGREWPGKDSSNVSRVSRAEGSTRPGRARSVASDVQHPPQLNTVYQNQHNGSRATSPENLPKFFYANEAKPRLATRPSPQSPHLQPAMTGTQWTESVGYTDSSVLSPGTGSPDEPLKFFYANRIQEGSPPAPRHAAGVIPSRPPLQTIFSSYQTPTAPIPRPPSPLKEEVLPVSRKSSLSKPSPRRHTRLVSGGSNDIRSPETVSKAQSGMSRRSSLKTKTTEHTLPPSPTMLSFNAAPSRRSSLSMADVDRGPASTMPIDLTTAESSHDDAPDTVPLEKPPPESPKKPAPGQSKLDHLNELAANARRERKVLDLEISNSSLLAINRTLEAEMRKQKSELRHLRRLRSSGRFASSTRSASSKFSMPSASDDLSPTSSADEDGMDDDCFSNVSDAISDDTSFPDSLSFSPTPRKSSIPTAKQRHSRSFKLDLSAQRGLLLDSQKLNQSLKRCLGRTDELIADGKKALDYQVDTGSLVNLGPRVLSPDQYDGESQMGRGLLSPGLDERLENPWERVRDSDEGWNAPHLNALGIDEMDNFIRSPLDGDSNSRELQSPIKAPELIDETEKDTGQANQAPPDETSLASHIDLPSHDNVEVSTTSPQATEKIPPEKVLILEPIKQPATDIPYEDPGIDTEGDTSTLSDSSTIDGIDDSKSTHGDKLKDNASVASEDEQPKTSSPAKGLGDFLRMVGGSWGV
ncbi:MAG: hypothetical protein Q9220_006521 [cf. Caloplaca sp. 1 TL-2023]